MCAQPTKTAIRPSGGKPRFQKGVPAPPRGPLNPRAKHSPKRKIKFVGNREGKGESEPPPFQPKGEVKNPKGTGGDPNLPLRKGRNRELWGTFLVKSTPGLVFWC